MLEKSPLSKTVVDKIPVVAKSVMKFKTPKRDNEEKGKTLDARRSSSNTAFDYRRKSKEKMKFPLLVGDAHLDSLLKDMQREKRIEDRTV